MDSTQAAAAFPTYQPSPPGLIDLEPTGRLNLRFHEGQTRAWRSQARFLLILAGAQSGKTSYGPWWLWRTMKAQGPGVYIAAAPTFKVLDKGVIRDLDEVFVGLLGLGKIVGGAAGEFRVSPEGHRKLWPKLPFSKSRIIFGHADNPDSLETMTAKGAWLDECGQKQFKRESWESISRRRLARFGGPCLMTTTPYLLDHWVKTDVWDAFHRIGTPDERPGDNDFDVVSFESRMNPAFPLEEWEKALASLPPWRFDLFFRGRFTRPAGAIYDCFDAETMVVPPRPIPDHWPRYCGIDFGSPNFAAVFFAEEMEEVPNTLPDSTDHWKKTGRLWLYREYAPSAVRTAKEHIQAMRSGERDFRRRVNGADLPEWESWKPNTCVGGSLSEGQWRKEFRALGFDVRDPDQKEVEVGIDRTYQVIRSDRLRVSREASRTIKDLQGYSRQIDGQGNVLEEILNKNDYHFADACRAILSYMNRTHTGAGIWFLGY